MFYSFSNYIRKREVFFLAETQRKDFYN